MRAGFRSKTLWFGAPLRNIIPAQRHVSL